jgi:hypothetical protein
VDELLKRLTPEQISEARAIQDPKDAFEKVQQHAMINLYDGARGRFPPPAAELTVPSNLYGGARERLPVTPLIPPSAVAELTVPSKDHLSIAKGVPANALKSPRDLQYELHLKLDDERKAFIDVERTKRQREDAAMVEDFEKRLAARRREAETDIDELWKQKRGNDEDRYKRIRAAGAAGPSSFKTGELNRHWPGRR